MSDTSRNEDAFDPVINIQEWRSKQLDAQVGQHVDESQDETAEYGEVTRLCRTLLDLFSEIIRMLPGRSSVPKEVRINLERSLSALILWSDGYGIALGDLDETFSKSKKLRHVVIKTLSHLGELLMESEVNLEALKGETNC